MKPEARGSIAQGTQSRRWDESKAGAHHGTADSVSALPTRMTNPELLPFFP